MWRQPQHKAWCQLSSFPLGPSGHQISLSFCECHLWRSLKVFFCLLLIKLLATIDILEWGSSNGAESLCKCGSHACAWQVHSQFTWKLQAEICCGGSPQVWVSFFKLYSSWHFQQGREVMQWFAFMIFPRLMGFMVGGGERWPHLVPANKKWKPARLLLMWIVECLRVFCSQLLTAIEFHFCLLNVTPSKTC